MLVGLKKVFIWFAITFILILQTISYFNSYEQYEGPSINIEIFGIIYLLFSFMSLSIFVYKLSKFIIEKINYIDDEKNSIASWITLIVCLLLIVLLPLLFS